MPAPFVKLAEGVPVEGILSILNSMPELWEKNEERQSYPGSAHHSTEAIFIRGPHELVIDKYQSLGPIKLYDAPQELMEALDPILLSMMHMMQIKEFGYVMFTSLHPHSQIEKHIDQGEYAEHYNRLHIPIYSKPGNVFKCDDKEVEMKEGELWVFDHSKLHSFRNDSDEERIHLIIDVRFV